MKESQFIPDSFFLFVSRKQSSEKERLRLAKKNLKRRREERLAKQKEEKNKV